MFNLSLTGVALRRLPATEPGVLKAGVESFIWDLNGVVNTVLGVAIALGVGTTLPKFAFTKGVFTPPIKFF